MTIKTTAIITKITDEKLVFGWEDKPKWRRPVEKYNQRNSTERYLTISEGNRKEIVGMTKGWKDSFKIVAWASIERNKEDKESIYDNKKSDEIIIYNIQDKWQTCIKKILKLLAIKNTAPTLTPQSPYHAEVDVSSYKQLKNTYWTYY